MPGRLHGAIREVLGKRPASPTWSAWKDWWRIEGMMIHQEEVSPAQVLRRGLMTVLLDTNVLTEAQRARFSEVPVFAAAAAIEAFVAYAKMRILILQRTGYCRTGESRG
jgi:hypothetical protein